MTQKPLNFLLFEIHGQRYGIPLSDVKEVIRSVAIARIPGAPALLEGAINVRGLVIPVIDVRVRFGLPEQGNSPSDHIIIITAGGRQLAIRVDRALAVHQIDPDDISDSGGIIPLPKHVDGVATLKSGLTVIYDVRKFLSKTEEEIIDSLQLDEVVG